MCAERRVRFPLHRGVCSVNAGSLGKQVWPQVFVLGYCLLCDSHSTRDCCCDVEPCLLRERIISLSGSFTFWESARWPDRVTGSRGVRKVLWVR